jgi:hypothetical protein
MREDAAEGEARSRMLPRESGVRAYPPSLPGSFAGATAAIRARRRRSTRPRHTRRT